MQCGWENCVLDGFRCLFFGKLIGFIVNYWLIIGVLLFQVLFMDIEMIKLGSCFLLWPSVCNCLIREFLLVCCFDVLKLGIGISF